MMLHFLHRCDLAAYHCVTDVDDTNPLRLSFSMSPRLPMTVELLCARIDGHLSEYAQIITSEIAARERGLLDEVRSLRQAAQDARKVRDAGGSACADQAGSRPRRRGKSAC
jgi:hypothetical protein